MKKQIIIFILFLLLFSGCGRTFSIENPEKVTIQSGSEILEITDAETVARLTQQITSLEFRRNGRVKTAGWDYWLKWYDSQDNVIFDAVIGSDGIQYGGFYWKCTNGTIDLAYLDELLDATTVTNQYSTIPNIVAEEAQAYINGDKSPEDVVAIIQNRVSIYLSERN